MKLSNAWVGYQSDKHIEGYSLKTLKAYQLQSNLLIRYFGDIDLNALTTESLKQYLSDDGKNLKPASLGHRVRFIKSLFRWAHDEGFLSKNHAAKLKEPKTGKRIPKFLTEKEIELLREACSSSMENAIFEFMYSTGCRIGEIASLDISSIDFMNRSAIVQGKGDKEREVYYNIRCDIWLKRYLHERSDNDPSLFVTERFPHRMSIAQMRYIIKRISSKAGVNKSIHPHQLRHYVEFFIMESITKINSVLGIHSEITPHNLST